MLLDELGDLAVGSQGRRRVDRRAIHVVSTTRLNQETLEQVITAKFLRHDGSLTYET
ncbi:hypothetical protein [Leifsonia sp. A12D58]|uniref:hypothetical protein n=1 Tax=Leifsonia sp. A12D58 TaxID=3397674 RepID=UPI0039E12057